MARRGGWRVLSVEYWVDGWVVVEVALLVVEEEEVEEVVDFCCWIFELDFWLSVPDSHLRRRRAENRFTRGGRVC